MKKYKEEEDKTKSYLDKDHWVVKRNILNEVKNNRMTFQEKRFFCIYLAKIDPQKPETKKVSFSLSEFNSIMGLKISNVEYYKKVFVKLLSHVLETPTGNGGYNMFQLFKRCRVDKEHHNGEWYIDIEAHEDALPLLFDFKRDFFKYRLWNALGLSGSNQLSMYENLKQVQTLSKIVISVNELKCRLGIGAEQYQRFGSFRDEVLEPCRKALEENTDIKFTYEPHGKKGRGGKILELLITISENTDYKKQIKLEEFLTEKELNPYVETTTIEENTVEQTNLQSIIIENEANFSREAEKEAKESDTQYELQKIREELNRLTAKLSASQNIQTEPATSKSRNEYTTYHTIAENQSHPLYWIARAITDRKTSGKNSITIRQTPEKYTSGILNNWIKSEYTTIEELIEAGEITEKDIDRARTLESLKNW
jgi:hypothetical protein